MKPSSAENKKNIINIIILSLLTISVIANQAMLSNIKKAIGIKQASIFESLSSIRLFSDTKLTGNLTDDATKLSFPQGVPDKYGQELNVSFDRVIPSIDVMKQYDPSYGRQKISLAGADKTRYINIGLKIACEFCCSATGLVFENGEAACGCAHSQAFRGLEAYLIKNHGSEYSDDEILRELARWKGHYFPKQMLDKTINEIKTGKYTPDVASLVLGLKLPKYDGNNTQPPTPSSIQSAPAMVGGC